MATATSTATPTATASWSKSVPKAACNPLRKRGREDEAKSQARYTTEDTEHACIVESLDPGLGLSQGYVVPLSARVTAPLQSASKKRISVDALGLIEQHRQRFEAAQIEII